MPGWSSKSVDLKDAVAAPAKVVVATGGTFKPDEDGCLTPGQWAANKSTEAHWLAGAAAGEKWDPDTLVNSEQFDSAIVKAKGHTFGHPVAKG